jgi:polysaccharide export outer membrane protein
MWMQRGIRAVVVVVLAAGALTGCKTDTSTNSASDGSSSLNAQSAGDGFTPSFNSAQRKGSHESSAGRTTASISDASAARTVDTLASVARPGSNAYRIGPMDVLDISVFQAPDLAKTVEVAENGTIDMPLLGETPAAGKTTKELEKDLNSRFGAKYLQNPQTTVTVKEFNSNRVTVSGAVKAPGVFPFKGQTLLQSVVMAGGLAPESNSMVLVLRESNGKRSAAKFNLNAIQTGRENDPPIESGDVIVADTSVVKQGLSNILKVLPLAGFAALL